MLTLTACGVDPAIETQNDNRNRAMLEHNDVSLEMQQAWGSKPRTETDTQAQRAWEREMRATCNPDEANDQIRNDLNVIYCEINAMRERSTALKR